MGFSLKDITKPISKAFDYTGDLLGGKSGPKNPYDAPNLDYLKTPLENPNYDFLKTSPDLMSGYKSASSAYAPPTGTADTRFQDYMSVLNAPSSVDQVREGMNKEQLDLLLNDIQTDTREKYGQSMMDSFGRGMFDPTTGADSDISRIGMAKTAAEGAKTAANARLQYSLADLERQAAKEKATQDAYGQRYGYGEQADSQGKQIAANLAGQDASMYNQLLTSSASMENQNQQLYANLLNAGVDRQNARDIAYGTGQASLYNAAADRNIAGRQPGAIEEILKNIQINLGNK